MVEETKTDLSEKRKLPAPWLPPAGRNTRETTLKKMQ
jgi:hypothetical protein